MTRQCRSCGASLGVVVADLGMQPLANELRESAPASRDQERFPLIVRLCEGCFLVQADDVVLPERLFGEYTYFSSYSASWLAHADRFAAHAIERFGLDGSSLAVELASNDGYLLRAFVAQGIPVLGVEPAANVAAVAVEDGIPTLVEFFGRVAAEKLLEERGPADLVVANNVLAHVPDVNDFVEGIAVLVGERGVASIEVPHVLNLLAQTAFDTIYHEHYSYFSLLALDRIVGAAGLAVVDVEELPTHGGSIRLTLSAAGGSVAPSVDQLRAKERDAGLDGIDAYSAFAEQVSACVTTARSFLDACRDAGEPVFGYGAAAKATVLLNAIGAGANDIVAVADRSPHKVGRFVPGTGIRIITPEDLLAARPPHVLVPPWNLIDEIATTELRDVSSWGGQLVTAVPTIWRR